MSRDRLTQKRAGEENDVYTMNGARPEEAKRGGNGSGDAFQREYQQGDTNSWKETPISTQETSQIAKEDEKRNDMNIGDIRLAYQELIRNNRAASEKCAKCMLASERALPGADEETLIANASDLMFLPEPALDAFLGRQASLAASMKAAAEEVEVEEEEKKEAATETPAEEEVVEEKEAAEEAAEEAPEEKEAAVDRIAALEDKISQLHNIVLSMAAGKKETPAEEAEEESEAEETPAEEDGDMEIDFSDEKEASSKTASSAMDSLDSVFQLVEPKASFSSSMVKKASAGSADDDLSALWGSTPDVSAHFC